MQSPANNTFANQPVPVVKPAPTRRRLLSLFILLAWFAVLLLAAQNRTAIMDWWKLRQYQPPAAVSALAAEDTLTDYGRKIFYVNRPEIEPKAEFARSCPNNGGEQTIVLGCYHGDQSGIFLLRVDDPRLNGVLQVTAAHEMLHGAYDRLSSEERKKVDAMLLDYFHHGLDDPRIIKTIAAYKQSEPDDLVNEMHSIFGSEVARLPAGLEQYYKQYFTDRSKVAAYAAQYQSEFTGREAQVAQYDAQLSALKRQIGALQDQLPAQQREIASRQAALLQQKNSGDTAGYNAGVPAYNSLVSQYNAGVQDLKELIASYNDLVEKRNAVALEEDQLVKSLSTDASPIR
jgi:hypothetical protein